MNLDGRACSCRPLSYGKEIALNQEKSCGAVVFTRRNGEILFVIVQEASGAYSFPKGHVEGSETEMQTAARDPARRSASRQGVRRAAEEVLREVRKPLDMGFPGSDPV